MKVCVIGAGAMGGAMVEGFVKFGALDAADVTLSAPHRATVERYVPLGVNVTTDNVEAARDADMMVLAVKPWVVEDVLAELKAVLDYGRQTVVSVAAGVGGDRLKALLDRGDGVLPQVLIAMPNIAVAVGCSMTFVVPVNAGGDAVGMVERLFGRVGQVLVTEERLLPAGTSLASCGIAYAMRYVRASMEGGVELGFKADVSLGIVLQTVKGAVALLQGHGGHPESEIDKVTTPGGLTIRGLNAMERAGFTNAVIEGLKG